MLDWAAWTPHSLDYSGPHSVVSTYIVVYQKAVGYALVFVAAWLLVALALKASGYGEEIHGQRRGTWALKAAMLLHHGFVTPLAFVGIMQDPVIMQMYGCLGCAEAAHGMNRSGEAPVALRAILPLTLGYFLGDLLLLSQWNLTKSGAVENGLMLFHHIASLLVWPATVYYNWAARYVIIMLSYEFTSFWLTVLWMLSAAQLKKSPVYKLSGLVFTLSFVLIRMVGAVPQLIAMFTAPAWSKANEEAAQPGGVHPLCSVFSMTLVAPHLINLFWGVKVVKGFAAVLFGGGSKDGSGKKGE